VLVVFSDLDGTLLDPRSYTFRAARPALEALRQHGIPLVLVSSKTRAELEYWRRRLKNTHPFVVENGGAIFIPRGYFPFTPAGASDQGAYCVLVLGRPYRELTAALEDAAAETETPVQAFHGMSVRQVRFCTGLPRALARLAKQREYDEPFLVEGRDPALLLRSIEQRGLRWTRGGRFYHVLGENDKAQGVRILIEAYRRAQGPVCAAGLGDGWNDVDFLRLMDVAIVLESPAAREIKAALLGAQVFAPGGPEGWNKAVQWLLERHAKSEVVP